MIRMSMIASPAAAMHYFGRELNRGDYYTKGQGLAVEQEMLGDWGGLGAEKLGLVGEVTKSAFKNLCENVDPRTGERLTARHKSGRRVGYDINFHAPKSVSLAMELGGDRRLLGAFRDSVADTMRLLEQHTRTRVRRGGADHTRPTSNLVYAEFAHFTARPVEGEPDPHMHAHCVVFNATFDGVEQRWKAADLGEIKRDMPYFQAAFHSGLALRVRELGYAVEKTAHGWEIAGIPEAAIKSYSRRTAQIEQAAKDRGVIDPESKARLGAHTRESKMADLTMDELRSAWPARLGDEDRRAIEQTCHKAQNTKQRPPIKPNAQERDTISSLEHAKAHLFERASVVPERRLKAVALEHGVGRVSVESVDRETAKAVEQGSVLHKIEDERGWVTTPEVLREEQQMLATVKHGRGMHDPIHAGYRIGDGELSDEQQHAVQHVLGSTDSVILVRGRAGVGKTRTMQEVVSAIEATGREVAVVAPTGMATDGVLRKDGFEHAQTVAHLLNNPDMQQRIEGGVIWADEAGLLSVPDLQRLVALAKDKDARLLLTGDTAQHQSVIRGDAMRLLEQDAGLPMATLATVRRQQHAEYKRAVESLARGDVANGVEKLDAMGAIREVDLYSDRADDRPLDRALAETYAESVEQNQSTLVIAPTHAEGKATTEAIREQLLATGRLGETESTVTKLAPRHLSTAQQRDAASYQVGDVVEFAQHAPGFRRGERLAVTRIEDGRVHAQRPEARADAPLPMHHADRYAVYEPQQLGLRTGDRVRITKPGRTADQKHRLHNGAIYQIDAINDDDGTVTLDNGWKLHSDFGHIAYGYCVTSNAAQGRTVDHVILAQTIRSLGATSMQQFYTSVSRGRQRCTVLTDDKDELLRTAQLDATRASATEMFHRQLEDDGIIPPTVARTPEQQRAMGLWSSRQLGQRLKDAFTRRHERHQSIDRGRNQDRGSVTHER